MRFCIIIMVMVAVLSAGAGAYEGSVIITDPSPAKTMLREYVALLYLSEEEAEVIITYDFEWVHDDLFVMEIPPLAFSVSLVVDGSPVESDLLQRKEGQDTVQVSLSQDTKMMVLSFKQKIQGDNARNDFLTSFFEAPFDARIMRVIVYLPRGAKISDEYDRTGTISPQPQTVGMDGERIAIKWVEEDVEKGFVMRPFVVYTPAESIVAVQSDDQKRVNMTGIIGSIMIFLLFISAMLIVWLWYRFSNKKNAAKGKQKYFREQELQVIRVLQDRDGECNQSQLSLITEIPKATLSRLLLELEERNVIKKEIKGNKNIIKLKESSWND